MKVEKEQHEEIRKLFAEGHTRKEIAFMYGISSSHVSHIVNNDKLDAHYPPEFQKEWDTARKRVLKGLKRKR